VRPWSDLAALWTLTRLVFEERPDIVHTHTSKAGALGRVAARLYNATRRTPERCVVIHTFHGHVFSGYFSPVVSAFVRVVERTMARLCDRIITVSDRQRADICRRYRIAPASKVDVVELASDLEPLLRSTPSQSERGRLAFDPHHIVFGYVGRFVAIKNVPTLLQAFARAAVRVPDARLLLVGDGELRASTERLARELALGDRVRFTGWRRDLANVYRAMDVCVLASRSEGMPLVLIEAMAAARPVIATAVGGVPDLIAPDATGVLVEPDDVEALSNAMVRLASDRGLRDRLGAAARAEVAERFSPDRQLSATRAVYLRALADRRGLTIPAPGESYCASSTSMERR
jgi:glycosyltransferase involved in cell wall biosynthesis